MGIFNRLPALLLLWKVCSLSREVLGKAFSLRDERFLIEKGSPVYSTVVMGNNPTNLEP